jgi:hypothetical protein
MYKDKTRNPQVSHSWGILLGMSALPVLALMAKLFATLDTLWTVLGVLSCALILRSAIGFWFPACAASPKKKTQQAATPAR